VCLAARSTVVVLLVFMDHLFSLLLGASAGIGAELAAQVVAQGGKVVLAARRLEQLTEIVGKVGGEENAKAVVTDVTKRIDHENLLRESLTAFGKVDCWVNNAGVGMSKPVQLLADEDLDLMFLTNTKSVLYGMQTVVPYYKERGMGHIINVSSMLGRVPFASFRAAYSASKAAMNSLTTNMRVDLHNEGFNDIQVSLFIPGVVSTDFGLNAGTIVHALARLPSGLHGILWQRKSDRFAHAFS
jgi:NADP-dependent 3-hydroxy acid dehydrogenase YdfG